MAETLYERVSAAFERSVRDRQILEGVCDTFERCECYCLRCGYQAAWMFPRGEVATIAPCNSCTRGSIFVRVGRSIEEFGRTPEWKAWVGIKRHNSAEKRAG
jgi:hypothetical protein